jgi:protocatechuate 3,4-dioxygenase beta subunit
MRFTVVLFAAACFAQSAPPAASISGRVVSGATGAPLKKAEVWIEFFSSDPARERRESSPKTITDAEGRFTLSDVAPGEYYLSVSRIGYLDQGYGAPAPQVIGPPISIGPGEGLRDVTVKLTPQSLLYGKVVDEDGDPVPGAQVQVLRPSFAGGKRRLVAAADGQAQDDGSFVIGNLVPGRYFLSAGIRNMDAPPGRERPVTTYFPSATTESAAAPIEVAAGAEVRGLAVRLRKSRVYSIRGRAVPPARVTLQLDNRSIATGADGRFEFDGLMPGTYEIRTNSAQSPLVGRARVQLTDGDLEDLIVPVGEGISVSGVVKGAATGRIAIGEETADIQRDGSFEVKHLVPDVHTLQVQIPEGSYVKMVSFDGRPVEDWKLDLTSGGGELLIAVSPDASEISGVVPNGRGALVQLWPAGSDTAKTVKAGARGEFTFKSLPPGDYRIAAFQDLDDDLAQYPPFRAAFEPQAAKVKVAEKAHERVEVKLVEREAIAAEAAKLQ